MQGTTNHAKDADINRQQEMKVQCMFVQRVFSA
jgi:hypothetical protein